MTIIFSVPLYPLLFTLYSYPLDLFVPPPNPLARICIFNNLKMHVFFDIVCYYISGGGLYQDSITPGPL